MLAQKCRLCGERHPLGPCPRNAKGAGSEPASNSGADSRPREARSPEHRTKKPRPVEKIIEGLTEALAVARGEAEPARVTTFDKKAWMRAYMVDYRKRPKKKTGRRAKQKAPPE